eukprot:TRINITY_DN16233_c0_g1_i1.p1 TRINITY_DN16233_c0_g1~~TRINITY_DN16233_c0_g1_i1.p1  ORF type:complete len:50 (+),score=0.31 TRINITY_DN16233_c0_g1_i1:58-207(+)
MGQFLPTTNIFYQEYTNIRKQPTKIYFLGRGVMGFFRIEKLSRPISDRT